MKNPYAMFRIVSNGNLFEAQGLENHDLYSRWERLMDGPFKNPASDKTTCEMLVDWYQNYYSGKWEVVESYNIQE